MFGKKKQEPESNLSELMEVGEITEDKPVGVGKGILHFIVGVLAISVFVAGAGVVPVALASSSGLNAGIDYWDGMEADLLKDEIRLPQVTTLLDKNGKEFAQFYSENRENVKLENVSEDFLHGLVDTEDSRFYETNGFDAVGLGRSFISTVTGKEKQGASGITQQLVKNILILNAETPEALEKVQNRVVGTKLQEMKYAIHLSDKYSKEEILEMYSNTVYFGNRAYGIKAAARTYFDTTPAKLTLEESAMLAGVINNPTVFDPFDNPENADHRKNIVLLRMLKMGNLTEKQYEKSIKVKVKPKRGSIDNGCGKSSYPYYCELVRQEMLSNKAFGEDAETREAFMYQGGLTITTAMDPKAMKKVKNQVSRAWGKKNRVASGIAVIKPGTGQIAAIGQNRKWGGKKDETQLIYAKSERQTGSAFKPYTLATAYEQGIDAGKTKLNSNSHYKPNGFDYPKPRGFSNFGYYDYGNVSGEDATRQSLNVWFVRMMQKTGVIPVAEMANRLGLSIPTDPKGEGRETSVNPRSLSLALGAWGASPIEMANAYSTFSSGGVMCEPVSILSAKRTYGGKKVKVSDPDCHQAIMPNIANQMNKILQQPFKKGGTLPDYKLNGGRKTAGKTGTSNDRGDAWVVGYTPQYSTAVWSGDPRGSSHNLSAYTQYGYYHANSMAGTGGPTSGPIWESIMNDLHKGLPKRGFAAPSNDVASAIKATAVPEVVGTDVDYAITTLQQYGYNPIINKKTDGDKKIMPPNTVVSQNPNGGNNATYGQDVVITLSPGSDVDIVIAEPKETKDK